MKSKGQGAAKNFKKKLDLGYVLRSLGSYLENQVKVYIVVKRWDQLGGDCYINLSYSNSPRTLLALTILCILKLAYTYHLPLSHPIFPTYYLKRNRWVYCAYGNFEYNVFKKKKNQISKGDNKIDQRLLSFCGKFLSSSFGYLLIYILTYQAFLFCSETLALLISRCLFFFPRDHFLLF